MFGTFFSHVCAINLALSVSESSPKGNKCWIEMSVKRVVRLVCACCLAKCSLSLKSRRHVTIFNQAIPCFLCVCFSRSLSLPFPCWTLRPQRTLQHDLKGPERELHSLPRLLKMPTTLIASCVSHYLTGMLVTYLYTTVPIRPQEGLAFLSNVIPAPLKQMSDGRPASCAVRLMVRCLD